MKINKNKLLKQSAGRGSSNPLGANFAFAYGVRSMNKAFGKYIEPSKSKEKAKAMCVDCKVYLVRKATRCKPCSQDKREADTKVANRSSAFRYL